MFYVPVGLVVFACLTLLARHCVCKKRERRASVFIELGALLQTIDGCDDYSHFKPQLERLLKTALCFSPYWWGLKQYRDGKENALKAAKLPISKGNILLLCSGKFACTGGLQSPQEGLRLLALINNGALMAKAIKRFFRADM